MRSADHPSGVRRGLLACVFAAASLGGLAVGADPPREPAELPPAATADVDFARQIAPLLRTRCHSCHGPEKQEAGLRLDQKKRAFTGGDHGASIAPGKSAESRLVRVLAGLDADVGRMPPDGEGTPLTREEIGLVRAWIDRGATWPDELAGGAAAADHWAFRPPVRSAPPDVVDRDWSRTVADRFVLAKLEAEQVAPAREAERRTLFRRATLDLLGLPADPAAAAEFAADEAPDAWERSIDRLIASPGFGERWGRHWLDLARYADSDGYEKDKPRPLAWRYRQWVIEAVNRDQPFDEFTRDQLAGDLLPDASVARRTAVGFHRNTLHNTEGGADPEEDRVKKTVDRTNTLGAVWLGLTVGCAQCHSHKYDPLSQREYFGLYAFFNSLQEVDVDAPTDDDATRLERQLAPHRARHERLVAALREYDERSLPAAQRAWEAYAESLELPAEILAIVTTPAERRDASSRKKLSDYYASLDEQRVRRKQEVDQHAEKAPKLPAELKAQSVAELAKPRPTHVQLRGDFLSPGDAVTRGVFEVLPPLRPRGSAPDRVDLADWLFDPSHPLTARVAANRIWRHLFGRGLVATVDDFGKQGDPPSHPELLDRLANDYREFGWSTKRFVRELLLSATYRQSSAPRPELTARDPENTWLARQTRRRVEAEIVRDLALATSGLLDRRVGGPSVRPRQPADHASLTYAGAAKWTASAGGDAYRRGLYTFFQRTSPYPMLMTFDSPDATETCTRRTHSNTPLQSLTLWNDPTFIEAAQRFARRVLEETPSEPGEPAERLARRRADRACELALGRPATDREAAALAGLHAKQLELSRSAPDKLPSLIGPDPLPSGSDAVELSGWVAAARVLLNLDEFLTRE